MISTPSPARCYQTFSAGVKLFHSFTQVTILPLAALWRAGPAAVKGRLADELRGEKLDDRSRTRCLGELQKRVHAGHLRAAFEPRDHGLRRAHALRHFGLSQSGAHTRSNEFMCQIEFFAEGFVGVAYLVIG